jgi:hypothetical protein
VPPTHPVSKQDLGGGGATTIDFLQKKKARD